ncbi:hypothetical protein, partial [Escherichia coli]
QPSGKNIIRWLLKKRTNGSVRYCQYTSYNGAVVCPFFLFCLAIVILNASTDVESDIFPGLKLSCGLV